MDLSKLNSMSKTPRPPSPASTERPDDATHLPQAIPYHHPHTSPSRLGDEFGLVSIWISLIVGVVSLMLGQRFGSWLVANLRGEPFHTNTMWQTGAQAGTEVAYFDLSNHMALTEGGLFLLGVVLLADAALMLLARRGIMSFALIYFGLALVLLTLIFNLYAAVMVFNSGVLPLYSLLAVLVAGIVFFSHFDSLKRLNHHRLISREMGAIDVAK